MSLDIVTLKVNEFLANNNIDLQLQVLDECVAGVNITSLIQNAEQVGKLEEKNR